jgi:TonB family protein
MLIVSQGSWGQDLPSTVLPAAPDAAAPPASAEQTGAGEQPQTVDPAGPTGDELQIRRDRAQRQFLTLYDDGNYEQSIFFANRVVELTRETFGNSSIELANPLMNLASAYRRRGDPQSALASYSAAIAIIEDNNDNLSAELINPLMGLGATYNDAELHALGLSAYQRALRITHVNGGFYNFEQIPARDGLTESYLGMENLEKADFEQTVQVSIYKREYGEDSPEILPAMYKVADWYHRTGQFENEQSIYTTALRMVKKSGGKTDPLLIDTYRRYAALYRRQELPEEAVRMQKKASEINEMQPEPNIMLRGDLLVELGDMYVTFGYSRRAVETYTEAWQVFAADPELYGERLEGYFSKPQRVRSMPIPAYYPRSSRSLDAADNPNMFGDGIVMARYTVTDRGRVEDVEIIESDPPDLLDDKVVAALRRSYFRPEFQDGLPVSRPDMTYVHEFKYDKTALRVAEEEKSTEDDRLPNPNEMDRGSSGALEYPQ